MALVNVSRIIKDPKFNQAFTVRRSSGSFVNGRWVETYADLSFRGVISVADAKTLQAMPEGDRITGAIVIHTLYSDPIYTTRSEGDVSGTGPGTSDIIVWRSEHYRILKVDPYVDYGYFRAVAERIEGN